LVIFASGLKYVGVPVRALGLTVAFLAAVIAVGLAVQARPWRRPATDDLLDPAGEAAVLVADGQY
jgi:hypothetical protein